ncbi:MAG: PLDc N-terminal domain-containing protein [Pseudomonadota bacterium]
MMIQYLGFWLLIALAFNMWALLSVLQSGAAWSKRLIWAIPLLCLPGLGYVGWYLLGPRARD